MDSGVDPLGFPSASASIKRVDEAYVDFLVRLNSVAAACALRSSYSLTGGFSDPSLPTSAKLRLYSNTLRMQDFTDPCATLVAGKQLNAREAHSVRECTVFRQH